MIAQTRSPPRWFAPSLFAGMLLAAAALAALLTTLYERPDPALEIGDRTYAIPPAEISALTADPIFVRIARADRPFEIVHDSRAAGRRDRTGMPHIFSVNDQTNDETGADGEIWYARDRRSTLACRRTGSAPGACGTWIAYGGVNWSVLFPESRIKEADGFARQATALLRKYDTRSSRIVP